MSAYRLFNTALLLAAAILAAGTMPGSAAEPATAKLGPLVPLRWKQGPVSFGLVLAVHVVPWSDPVAQDLLISRCWEGVYLYPSRNLTAEELSRDPIRVCPPFTEITMGRSVDWNRDGKHELINTDRRGYFYLCDRQGGLPKLAFPPARPERAAKTGLEFNLPFENPNLPRTNSLGGYTKPRLLQLHVSGPLSVLLTFISLSWTSIRPDISPADKST